MLKTIVVDDEQAIVDSTSEFLKTIPYVHLLCSTTDVAHCLNAVKLSGVDVAILDIDMPAINGIEFAETLNQIAPAVEVIFITSHDSYLRDAFKVYAYDFIEKPVDYDRLKDTMARLHQELKADSAKVAINVDEQTVYLAINDIYMVEAQGKRACVYTKDAVYCAKESLKEIEQLIKSPNIFKSSRSFLINLTKISAVEKYARTSLAVNFKEVTFSALLSKNLYEDFKVALQLNSPM